MVRIGTSPAHALASLPLGSIDCPSSNSFRKKGFLMAREPRSGKDDSGRRVVNQEKRLIALCIVVAVIMLLSLSRYLFE